jgi:very-short-patch-repair endonuclease
MVARARELRNNATEEERWLWYRLRGLRKFGYHFRRQSPFARYVLDFVCHDAKTVVELDGSQHGTPENAGRDKRRDDYLLQQGYRTIRIPNWWVREDTEWVADKILHQLCGGESATPTPAPPRKGEGERKPRTNRPNKGRPQPKFAAPTIDALSPLPLAGRGRGGGPGGSTSAAEDKDHNK